MIDVVCGAVVVLVHACFIGLVICGFVLNGYSSSVSSVVSMFDGTTYATINSLGQFRGAIIERITTCAFGILAIAIGSVFGTIDDAGGWHFDVWRLKILGYQDAYASGVINAIAGRFALGVLVVLGPRIGRL